MGAAVVRIIWRAEQMIHLLVAKVGYDGRTGKVTVNFRSAGAKQLCQAKSH
jgi:hypothetical protein